MQFTYLDAEELMFSENENWKEYIVMGDNFIHISAFIISNIILEEIFHKSEMLAGLDCYTIFLKIHCHELFSVRILCGSC